MVSLRNRDNDCLLCHWTDGRFQERLEDMMSWYTHENNGQYQQPIDPWQMGLQNKDLNQMATKELYK